VVVDHTRLSERERSSSNWCSCHSGTELNLLVKKIDIPERLRVVCTHSLVDGLDGLHVFLCQLEIEDVEVRLESCNFVGLGDHHSVALNPPPKCNLGGRLVVLLGDPLQRRILKSRHGTKHGNVGSSSPQRRVRGDRHPMLLVEPHKIRPLKVRVRLNLVHSRLDLRVRKAIPCQENIIVAAKNTKLSTNSSKDPQKEKKVLE
jgi:hypothetical protein